MPLEDGKNMTCAVWADRSSRISKSNYHVAICTWLLFAQFRQLRGLAASSGVWMKDRGIGEVCCVMALYNDRADLYLTYTYLRAIH